jgi:hypothetical protein
LENSTTGAVICDSGGKAEPVVLSDWTRDGDFSGAYKVLKSIREVPGEVLRMAGR